MLEILNEQYQSKRAFTQNKNAGILNRTPYPSYWTDLYPMGQDYYHEFNPQFTFNVTRPETFRFAKTFTIRDGAIPFAHFLLKNLSIIPNLKTHLIVNESLANLIPPSLKEHFSLWSVAQNTKLPFEKVKKVLIFALLCDQYLTTKEEIKNRLRVVSEFDPAVEIELYIPARKNPFDPSWKDSVISQETLSLIKEVLGNRKLHFHTTTSLLEKTDLKGYYFIDLAQKNFLMADSYMDYFVSSRAGFVQSMATTSPENSIFELDLSFNHTLYIKGFTQAHSHFADLLFYKKQSIRDPLFDPLFHEMVKGFIA